MKKIIVSIIILFSISSYAISHVEHYQSFDYLEYELFRNNKSIGYHKYNFEREKNKNGLTADSSSNAGCIASMHLSKIFFPNR